MTDKLHPLLTSRAQQPHVLIVDDEPSIREVLEIFFEQRGFQVSVCEDAAQAEEQLKGQRYSFILTDLRLPKGGGMRVLALAQEHQPRCPVVIMTAFASTATAIEAMKRGAYDYLTKPFELDALDVISQKAIDHSALIQENEQLRAELDERDAPLEGLIGQSEPMKALTHLIKRVSPSKTPILILGESGTGKEMVAQAIHRLSPRAQGPFVVINCAAIPEHLFESELFGHVKGAFTGANERRMGLFQAADGGTLFLDEIGEMPLSMQAKVLRAIQFMRVKAVGATEERAVDIRILAATNRSLSEDVQRGLFREDLYYRLNVIPIMIPPLRERSSDVPLLVEHFLQLLAADQGRALPRVSPEVMTQLLSAPLLGNVRELKNLVERALALSNGHELTMRDFMLLSDLKSQRADLPLQRLEPPYEGERRDAPEASVTLEPTARSSGLDVIALCDQLVTQVAHEVEAIGDAHVSWDLDRQLELLEERFLQRALERCGGNRTEAARLLGISFRSIRYRLKKLKGSTPPPHTS